MANHDPMSTLLGRHYVYRTQAATDLYAAEVIACQLDIAAPFLWRAPRVRWRTTTLNPPLEAVGTARFHGQYCVIALQGTERLTSVPFSYVFQVDEWPGFRNYKIGILAGRTSRTGTPYHAEVLMSREALDEAAVVATLGPASTSVLYITDVKARLEALVARGQA